MAAISFPNGHQGLEAYRQLREFRKRHEHEWTAEEVGARVIVDGRLDIDLKTAGRRVMDQKANSIADLACVLQEQKRISGKQEVSQRMTNDHIAKVVASAQAKIPEIKEQMRKAKGETRNGDTEAWARYKSLKAEKMRIPRALAKPRPDRALQKKFHPLNDGWTMPKRGARRNLRLAAQVPILNRRFVHIFWADLKDAEFAKTWPWNVKHHDELDQGANRERHTGPPVSSIDEKAALRDKKDEEEQAERRRSRNAEAAPEHKAVEAQPRPPVIDDGAPPLTVMQRLTIRLRDGAQ